MANTGATRFKVSTVVAAISLVLAVPFAALAASRSFGGSARFSPSRIQRQHHFPRRFDRFGFVDVDGAAEQHVVVIQQIESPAPVSRAPAKNQVYVPPQWVDGGYGVQILRPGYWAEPK